MTDRLSLVHRVSGTAVVVWLAGEADIDTAPFLRERLSDLADQDHRRMVLDLSGLDFLDSSGLAVLVGVWKRLRIRGATLTLAAPSPQIQRILAMTRLELAFTIHSTLAEACDVPLGP